MFVSAIVLAAGESKRMGIPKLLLPFRGSTMMEQSVSNLLNSRVNEIIVVVGFSAEEHEEKIAKKPVKIVVNPLYEHGMSTSIRAGLDVIHEKTKAVMIALADQPLIGTKTINRLIREFQKHGKGIAVPVYQGKRGHPVIFSIEYKEELMRLEGDIGGRQIIDEHQEDVLEIPVNSDNVNIDIDTLDDYMRFAMEDKTISW